MSWFFIIAFAFLNRARGSRLYDLTSSTVFGRVLSMSGMALISTLAMGESVVSFTILLSCLMLWATPAWDLYWSAQIGNEKDHKPAWGNRMMFYRQLLIIPFFIALAVISGHPGRIFWAATSLLYWLPYWLFAFDKTKVIPRAEYTIGALIGFTAFVII